MADEELCKVCGKHKLGDFFEKSMCMYCGEPFCAQCVHTKVTDCPCCKRDLGPKSDKVVMKNLLRIEDKIKNGKIQNPERMEKHLYICIAGRYMKGQGCKKDWKKAEKYYLKASKMGSPVADYNLHCLYFDLGKEDYDEYLERAVEKGYHKALCTKALSEKCGMDPKKAHQALKMRSALAKKELYKYFQVHPEATTTEIGLTPESIRLLRQAVKGKYHDALFEWAVAVQFGHTPETAITCEMSEEEVNRKIDENAKKSVMWYKLAAFQGHGLAMNNLGVIYKNGLGADPPNLEEAYGWYNLSHNTGCNHGTFGVGTIWEERAETLKKKREKSILTVTKVEEMKKEEEDAYREAGRYYGFAAQKAFTPALFQLGFLMVTRRLPPTCLVGEREIQYKELEMIEDGFLLIKDAAMRGNRHAQRYLMNLKKGVDDVSGEEKDGELSRQIYSTDETVEYPVPMTVAGTQD